MKREMALRRNEMVGGEKKRRLTTQNLALAMLPILESHIGQENAISKAALFKQVFGKKYDDTNLADYMRWEFMRKAMHLLRQRSNCFVAGGYNEQSQQYEYFVLKSHEDAMVYNGILNNSIKRMVSMQKRAVKSVEQEWWRQKWVLPTKSAGVQLVSLRIKVKKNG